MGKIEFLSDLEGRYDSYDAAVARYNAFEEGGAVERLLGNKIENGHFVHLHRQSDRLSAASLSCPFCKALAELEALLTKKEE